MQLAVTSRAMREMSVVRKERAQARAKLGSGTLSPRSTRSSRKPFHASFDSLPHISSDTSCFCPSASTATAASTGTLVTLPALRTRSAIASRYRYATSSSANERFVHASHALLSVPTTRETALFESGAALSSGLSAPWMRRVFAPARYALATASLTSALRR